jgi:LPPG:FO 2-phospho-L-lactate transferase
MNDSNRVVLLVGGVGGAKLAVGLADILPPECLTIIVNTADDFEHLGLHVSPDLDTVMYSLAGVANPDTGWGVAGDTFQMIDMLDSYGGPTWFKLGDRDLATNLKRTQMLREGKTFAEVTQHLSEALGVQQQIVPMSNDSVQTWIDTAQGGMAFQEYFVRERWQPEVKAITFRGAEQAEPAPLIIDALDQATLIVLGPSNPYLSIDPILAVSGIREYIEQAKASCVAVSPIVGGKALKGPAAALMAAMRVEVSPLGIARHYDGLLDGIIIDTVDRSLCAQLEAGGLRTVALNTIMNTRSDKVELARQLLRWAEEDLK